MEKRYPSLNCFEIAPKIRVHAELAKKKKEKEEEKTIAWTSIKFYGLEIRTDFNINKARDVITECQQC